MLKLWDLDDTLIFFDKMKNMIELDFLMETLLIKDLHRYLCWCWPPLAEETEVLMLLSKFMIV